MIPRIQSNIFANFVARGWGFISAYLFIPLYLRFLGVEAYGLVGFYSTLLGVLSFADMGFTATLNRELARLSVRDDSTREMRDLLRTYESVYLVISILVAAALWVLAPWFSMHWLRMKVLQPAETTSAIRLLGFSIALQLPSAMYLGGLMGLQQQVRAGYLQVATAALRGFGGVLVLWLVSPTIFAFALWQLASNAINYYAVRLSLWRALSPKSALPSPSFRWQAIKDTWRYAAGMASMAALSALLMHTDKLVVSKVLTLETFGYYSLASALASLPVLLGTPIVLAVFPRLTGLVEVNDRASAVRLYHQTCEVVAIATIPAGLTLAAFAGDALLAWTGSAVAAERGGLVATLLIVGQLMQVLTIVPYYVVLAHGQIRLLLQVVVSSVVLITPLLVYLVLNYGVVGAGISWLVMNICTVPPYMYCVHHRFLPTELRRWCVRDVFVPLLAGMPPVLLGRWLVPQTGSRMLTICLMGLVWSTSAAATALTLPEVRSRMTRYAWGLLGPCAGRNGC